MYVPGVYRTRYNVSDDSDNEAAEVTQTVTVQDTQAPAIALIGEASATVECGDAYVDAGATAEDGCEGDMTPDISVTSLVDANTPGVYTVRYNVSDSPGNAAAEVSRTVTVLDTQAPIIWRVGASFVSVDCGGDYMDAGATAMDSCEGDLSGRVVVTNPVDTNIPGTYTVRYNVSDSSGNAAAERTRTVQVFNNCETEEGEGGIEGEDEVPAEGEHEGEVSAEEEARTLLGAFGNADANGDGFLTCTEAQGYLPGLSQEAFDAMDSDANGVLSQEELEAYAGGGTGFPSCVKRAYVLDDAKRWMGDWLLLGVTALALFSMGRRREV